MPVAHNARHDDTHLIFRVCLCLFLGCILFLFVRTNALLAHGGRNFRDLQVVIMLVILGMPFLFSLWHLVRGLLQQPHAHE